LLIRPFGKVAAEAWQASLTRNGQMGIAFDAASSPPSFDRPASDPIGRLQEYLQGNAGSF